jgi:hypothetical protein
MKTFNQFIAEERERRAPKKPGESTQDYIKRVRGITDHPDAALADTPGAADPRVKGKTTRVSGSTVRGAQQASTASKVTRALKGAQSAKTAAEVGSAVLKDAGKFGKVKSFIGKAAVPAQLALDTGLEAAAQKARGRKTGSSLAMGATKAAGGWAGMKAGATGGAAIGTALGGPVGTAIGGAIGGIGGYMAGSGIAGKASEVVAGATGKEKVAMAQRQRQSQAGGGLAGIGGKTTFSKGKGGTAFMSTGAGKQRKTVQLDKTSVVRDAKGKEAVGHLAFKGGKAVYKRAADPSTLARTSSNPFERIGRSLFAGAYKKSDEAQKQKSIAAARQSDVKRQQKLGVKMKPGG